MELPANESTFNFDHTGAVTGQKFTGEFKVICILNMRQKHLLEVEKSKFLMDYANPTEGLATIAILLANLRVRIIEGPEWWKQSQGGLNVIDEDMLLALFSKLLEAEEKWRETVKKKNEALSTPQTPSQPQTLL